MHIAERNENLPNRRRLDQQLPAIASDQRGRASHLLDVPLMFAFRFTGEDEVSRAVPAYYPSENVRPREGNEKIRKRGKM
jgi:hypothetical protein